MSNKNNVSDTTSDICVARQKRKLTTTWTRSTEAEEGSKLLRALRREGVGTKEMEGTVTRQVKAKKMGDKIYKRRGELLKTIFAEKLEDSYRWEVKRRRRRAIDRMKLEDLLGAKSRRYRNIIKEVKMKSDRFREECKSKNKEKLEHLVNLYGDRREKDQAVDLPAHLKRYEGVRVFMEGCDLICEELKGPVIVEREGHPLLLSRGERVILTLGPKFCVYEDCNEEKFVTNIEISFLKYKWDRMSDTDKEPYVVKGKIKISNNEESDTQSSPVPNAGPVKIDENTAKQDLQNQAEENRIKQEIKKVEAMARSVFMEEEMTFDYSKKRATDMKQNTHVHLPGALGLESEAGLEVLRQEWRECYRKFTQEKCNQKKEQESNLTKEEKDGLTSLRKRIKEGELIVVPTDKSGRFSIMDLETYTQAGLKHAAKDEVVSIDQIKDNQHELNGQVSMLLKIFRVGGTWGHYERARGNMLCNSEMICNMYVLFKDHKGWHLGLGTDPPGRPIASGNGGQNIHMSELTSEIIESVVTAYKGGVEIISTEDMLAKWDALNRRNEKWHPGEWWDNYEEDDLITCGRCIDEEGDICLCTDWTLPKEGDELVEERRARTASSTEHLTSQELKEDLVPEGGNVPDERNVPEGRVPNRIEEFLESKGKGELKGQKMKITIKFMKEKRRRKWERDFQWLEGDLDRLIDSSEANP